MAGRITLPHIGKCSRKSTLLLRRFRQSLRATLTILLLIAFVPTVASAYTPQQRRNYANTGIYFISDDSCSDRNASTYGDWDPLSLTYPNIPDEPALIDAVKEYIQTNARGSPFASNPQYVDTVFSLSKLRNVNPLLVLSIARQENWFGSIGPAATQNNNYFGMLGDGPGGYLAFPTPEDGIDYFIERASKNISSKSGSYVDLTNFYEYLSIHQLGFIAYPGEYPEGKAQGANAVPPYLHYDPLMDVYTSWEPGLNRHVGQSDYNPGIYYKNSISFINAVTGSTLPDVPSRPGTCIAGQGLVDSQGYSFPLAPQTRIPYGTLPCHNYTCHHDGTPAFDLLYSGVAGKAVYAILDGQIVLFTTWGGTCQSIQLLGKDGYYYWYGHITNVQNFIDVNKLPVAVSAGQQIGVVDTWSPQNNCNGTSGASHLHIDRGRKGLYGGIIGNRDPNFVPLLQAIYERLSPEAGNAP